jgi:diaminohydroxyphosphoribosylaminopyrimidine deaminase/5-amino-6-(5-phosphoribosylamino)uracil reductase
VHQELRKNTNAILTTAKNIIADKASLNIRIDKTTAELSVVAIDRDLDLLKEEHLQLPIFYERINSKIYLLSNKTVKTLPKNVEIINVEFDKNNNLILESLGEKLLHRNLCKLLVEAGSSLSTYLIKNNWADELVLFIAPKLILDKQALNIFEIDNQQLLIDANDLQLLETKVLGNDMMLRYFFN